MNIQSIIYQNYDQDFKTYDYKNIGKMVVECQEQKCYCNPLDEEMYAYKPEEKKTKNRFLIWAVAYMLFILWLLLVIF
jgi:hemerythrin-like domain-containing protein